MTVRIYNTLTQKKDEIKGRGLDPRHINMYVCGPTVYDSPHVGHARSYIFFDTLRRVLLLDSYSVNYIQNFSDVDEKIDIRAAMEHVVPSVISERYKEEFLEDMDALNVLRSDVYTNASHIKDFMHKVTKILMDNGTCYRAGDNIYFDASSGGGFGSLIHDSLDNLIAGNESDGFRFEKRDKQDFVIWIGDFKPDSFKDSEGRPSWNLECFSIVHRQVGCELDIQGGGMDLIFPHHEVSSVLSKSYCNVEFASFYIHNAFVTMKKDKMSKSARNYVGTRELLKKHGPDAIRLYLLSRHFRENIEYDEANVNRWGKTARELKEKLTVSGAFGGSNSVPVGKGEGLTSTSMDMMRVLKDDMHTETAVDMYIDAVRSFPSRGSTISDLRYMSAALGLFSFRPVAGSGQNGS